ncbi:beta-galactosidase [Burkholderia alba]|uniref:beta-galactosidase n=1 Tax=Burkholderia alba TaxID=2683677 RepID=UPI002B061514|nr:beta-galactosidase [Burkholderia alba]
MDRRSFISFSALVPILSACGGGDDSSGIGPAGAAATESGSALAAAATAEPSPSGLARHTFSFSADGAQFLLDGQAFQIRSGEMHPARIPVEYWQHRIRMAKAMGMNTIALYIMWNYHETVPGQFDFKSDNRDIEAFIRLCQAEGMWVLLRPGPYVCGEWDLGGIPSYLLRYPDIQLRTRSANDPHYMAAVGRYIGELIPRIRPLLVANGGPILMIQIENEFGSYASDSVYMEEVRQLWVQGGIQGPFYTEDGLSQLEQNQSNVTGGAIALSGGTASDIAAARRAYPSVPAMAGEVYPGWLTHWGDAVLQGTATDITATLTALMQQKLSFNIYVIHGGTSFGFFAGANADNNGGGYQPDITSYDYAAPISEQGVATAHYTRYRALIARYLKTPLPPVPRPIPTLTRQGADAVTPTLHASLWDNLPAALPASRTVNPQPFEMYGQAFGFVLYRKALARYAGGTLNVTDVHDYATVFVGGQYMGGLSRAAVPSAYRQRLGVVQQAPLPLTSASVTSPTPTLEILVEGMGRVNYGHALVDRKGILESVALQDPGGQGGALTGWDVRLLPMDDAFVAGLRPVCTDARKSGLFFKATFQLSRVGDTYLDMSGWTKGVVWVNGRNLGRYWSIGPQTRLYCPAPWLKAGANEVIVFDLHQLEAKPIAFAATLA